MTEILQPSQEQQTDITPELTLYYGERFRKTGWAVMQVIEASDYVQAIDRFSDKPVQNMSAWTIGEFDGTDRFTEDPIKVALFLVENGTIMTKPKSGFTHPSAYNPGVYGETEADVLRLHDELIGLIDDEQFRNEHTLSGNTFHAPSKSDGQRL